MGYVLSACLFRAGMKEAFDRLAYVALTFDLRNLDANFHQAVRVGLNTEFASAGLRVLVSDTLNLSSECFSGHWEL
jgi:hypothetical protein